MLLYFCAGFLFGFIVVSATEPGRQENGRQENGRSYFLSFIFLSARTGGLNDDQGYLFNSN